MHKSIFILLFFLPNNTNAQVIEYTPETLLQQVEQTYQNCKRIEEKGTWIVNINPNPDKNAYTSEQYTFQYDNQTRYVNFSSERKMHQSYPQLDSKVKIFGHLDNLICEDTSSLGKNDMYKRGLIKPNSHIIVYSNLGRFLFSNEKHRGIIF